MRASIGSNKGKVDLMKSPSQKSTNNSSIMGTSILTSEYSSLMAVSVIMKNNQIAYFQKENSTNQNNLDDMINSLIALEKSLKSSLNSQEKEKQELGLKESFSLDRNSFSEKMYEIDKLKELNFLIENKISEIDFLISKTEREIDHLKQIDFFQEESRDYYFPYNYQTEFTNKEFASHLQYLTELEKVLNKNHLKEQAMIAYLETQIRKKNIYFNSNSPQKSPERKYINTSDIITEEEKETINTQPNETIEDQLEMPPDPAVTFNSPLKGFAIPKLNFKLINEKRKSLGAKVLDSLGGVVNDTNIKRRKSSFSKENGNLNINMYNNKIELVFNNVNGHKRDLSAVNSPMSARVRGSDIVPSSDIL